MDLPVTNSFSSSRVDDNSNAKEKPSTKFKSINLDQEDQSIIRQLPSAKVLLDSVNPGEVRVITLEVVLHRFVLAEFNTHRVFSRNSASSRAIPIKKVIDKLKEEGPAYPVEWGKNCPGMSSKSILETNQIEQAEQIWLESMKMMIQQVEKLGQLGVHKQIANRLLEPFKWHHCIVTSTEWNNFFQQRIHPDAQPEIRMAAKAMKQAINESYPKLLKDDEWHMPLLLQEEREDLSLTAQQKISVARCARVSYLNHHGVRDIENDLELYEKLYQADPPHLSPFEHVCRPSKSGEETANLFGWTPYRKILKNK